MTQYSRNTTAGIAGWRTTRQTDSHEGEDTPYIIGTGPRYTSGMGVIGMEFHPDYYLGKTTVPNQAICKICGDTVYGGRAQHCARCAPKVRLKTFRENFARAKSSDIHAP